jgi:hypothetical protein
MSWDADPWGYLDDIYLDTPEAYEALAKAVRAAGIVGLDSEFYGLDVRKESCVGKARIHVWSVAIRTGSRSPLGFHRSCGWVLPVSALGHAAVRGWLEDPSITKCCHNQPVDDHAFHNEGVELKGCVNTLGLARWVWPDLVTAGGFGLKNLMMVRLGRAPIAEYMEVVSDLRTVQVVKVKKKVVSRCSCGVGGCRKRTGHTKEKATLEIEEVTEKQEKFQHPLESIVQGHFRWELLVKYAAEDAVAALEVEQLARKQKNPAPFPYTKTARPQFNQSVENSVVLMERAGIAVDTKLAGSQAEVAIADETKELDWLHAWFVVNGAIAHGPYRREDSEGIWSSPKQLAELFDSLDFPRSPVWKKGKVKPGEVKMDGVALGWIGKNCKESRQVVNHILKLKKIRSGKKYLVKLRDCGGWVNPICGAAGDADDRNGAISGRLGIKGVIELQQLPMREEADLYQVRKTIVAKDMRGDTYLPTV